MWDHNPIFLLELCPIPFLGLDLIDPRLVQITPMPLQFLNYSQDIPILRLQTTPSLFPVYSYSQTITILKLIKTTPI